MNPNQLVSDLVSSLLKGKENHELEELISTKIEECCVIDKFYTLPFDSISRILDLSRENLTQEIVSTILTKLVENKRSGQACLLLLNIDVSKATLGQCCSMLGCIKPAPLCKLLYENWTVAKTKIYTLYDELDAAKENLQHAQNDLQKTQKELLDTKSELDALKKENIRLKALNSEYNESIHLKDKEIAMKDEELNKKIEEIQELNNELKEFVPRQTQPVTKKQEETMKRVSSISSLKDIVEKPLKFIEKIDEAVKAGDLTSVRYNIKNGGDIEKRDSYVLLFFPFIFPYFLYNFLIFLCFLWFNSFVISS